MRDGLEWAHQNADEDVSLQSLGAPVPQIEVSVETKYRTGAVKAFPRNRPLQPDRSNMLKILAVIVLCKPRFCG